MPELKSLGEGANRLPPSSNASPARYPAAAMSARTVRVPSW